MELTAVIVDDVAEELERVRSVLSTKPGIRVVGEASSGFEALPILEQLHPDVLVLDLGLPDLGGLQILQRNPPRSGRLEIPRRLWMGGSWRYRVGRFKNTHSNLRRQGSFSGTLSSKPERLATLDAA